MAITPLQSFLRSDKGNNNNDPDIIAGISNYWKTNAYGNTSVGLKSDPRPTSTPDYYLGAIYVQTQIKDDLKKWIVFLDQSSIPYDDYYKGLAVSRLIGVFRNHDRRLLWGVLQNGIDGADNSNDRDGTEYRSCSILVKAICDCEPELAFRSSGTWFQDEDGSKLREKAPVEACVANQRAAFLLETLLDNARAVELIRDFYVAKGTTPLGAALQARNMRAVEILLQKDREQIADRDVSTTLMFRLNDGQNQDVELMNIVRWIVVEYPESKIYWFAGTLLTNNADLVEICYAPEVLEDDDGVVYDDIIRDLILLTMMDDRRLLALPGFPDACLRSSSSNSLLHLAVQAKRVELARYLAEHTEGAYTQDIEGHYALWYNNKDHIRGQNDYTTLIGEDGSQPHWKTIRDIVTLKLIRSCDPETIDEVIQGSNDKIGEYSFDLSDFNAHSIRFDDFLDAFMSEEQQRTKFHDQLKFEPVLKYVQFPDLPSNIVDAAVDHPDIVRVFEWLWKKGVREILRLVVPDRLWGPQSEKVIAFWVATYKVEILHWRCQDLSFTHLASRIATKSGDVRRAIDNVKEIHLYSSGKSAVHQYWLDQNGLMSFPKIENVYIRVIEDFLPKPLVREAIAELDRISKPLAQYLKTQGTRTGKVRCRRYSSSTHRKVIRGDTLKEITTRAFKELSEFLDLYRHLTLRKKTRVVIIDNGIMATSRNTSHLDPPVEEAPEAAGAEPNETPQMQGNILEHIVDGKSFVHAVGNRRSSYFVAADPHGTQMAALICALDPLCEILIAKVAERRSDIFPDRVAKAIHWAMTQDVDIISMSFVCERSNNLMGAIREAQMKNILLFSSCHDEGFNKAEAFPAQCSETLAIAACGQQGDLIYNIPDNDYQYRLRGRDVFVGRVAQLDSKETITGSSVATATAAGMASLILSCLRFCDRPRPEVPRVPFHERRLMPGRVQDNQATVSDEDSTSNNELHRVLTNGVRSRPPSIRAHPHAHSYPQASVPAPASAVEQATITNSNDMPCLTLPDDEPNSDWRRVWVEHFFKLMNPTSDRRYVALDRFCNLHTTNLKEVNFERNVIRAWFCGSRPSSSS